MTGGGFKQSTLSKLWNSLIYGANYDAYTPQNMAVSGSNEPYRGQPTGVTQAPQGGSLHAPAYDPFGQVQGGLGGNVAYGIKAPNLNNVFGKYAIPPLLNPQSYQIKQGDTFDTIGEQFGIPASEFQNVNNQLVVPPKGSYVTVPQPPPAQYLQSERTSPAASFTNEGQGTYRNPQTVQRDVLSSNISQGNLMPIPFNLNQPITINGKPATMDDLTALGYVPNPATGQWEHPASNVNPNVSSIGNGQYVDQYGNTRSGTTPFGVNAQGQRLDVSGNVFNAQDAGQATDIYGGRVVQEGARKWVRGKDGVVRRAIAKGGKWQIQKPKGGMKGAPAVVTPIESQFAASTPVQQLSLILGSG